MSLVSILYNLAKEVKEEKTNKAVCGQKPK